MHTQLKNCHLFSLLRLFRKPLNLQGNYIAHKNMCLIFLFADVSFPLPFHCYLTMLSVLRLYSVVDSMINEHGTAGGMRTGKRHRNTMG